MATISKQVAAGIPRGHRGVGEHMLRAAADVVLLLAEGANRHTPKEKRHQAPGPTRGRDAHRVDEPTEVEPAEES